MGEQPAEPLHVLVPGGSEPEPAAQDDRAVPAGKLEAVKRLDVQGRVPPDPLGGPPAAGDHVGRRVDAVDVQAIGDPRHQQPPGSAGGVEGRLTGLDDRAEELDLRPVEVEVRPPLGDQTVVPRDDVGVLGVGVVLGDLRTLVARGGHPPHDIHDDASGR